MGIPITQDILYKPFHPDTKVDTRYINIIQLTCVASTFQFENVRFGILKHGTVYNLPQVENDGV